jgi:hypothetical protein
LDEEQVAEQQSELVQEPMHCCAAAFEIKIPEVQTNDEQ